ncbi:alpha/beta hydrolase [Streptomyces angustmyceticus]|uniref:Alpha/beta hydrolase n=1 Tax=Streptomyces angustmyceticus TaxID=285578 RepID=A0A5J4LCF8_9ACTN|nr:alpha/beta hydrolase [Streptomyces angustmyceticus]UAL65207.1 alpha/beta hydrolase [Streptomyces angustmyceticus]GES28338.1 hypothetical protein San01_08250 [Streptomyces angustmyceticus]
MTYVSGDPAPGPTRRTTLAGLVGGAGAVLAAGCSAPGPSPAPTRTAGAPAPADGATPGAMTLFKDPGFNFNGLLALGASGYGAAEVGEVLTAVNTINKAGLSAQTFTKAFRNLGDQLRQPPRSGRPGTQTTRFRALRAAQYYGQALFFVLGSDHPGSEEQLYRAGRESWDAFCERCDPAPLTAHVPYGRTPLPVWFFRPDTSHEPRPTVILTNGSDGQDVDMWTYGVAAFEHRIAALVAMPGVLQPWLGFPPEIREILTPSKEKTNAVWNKEVVPELPPSAAATLKKRFEPFSVPAMLAARRGKMFTDFYTPATLIRSLDITDVVRRITMPTLILDYEDEQFYPGQPRQMFDKLTAPKDYMKLTAATGAQLHCSPMAPQQHCEVVFDWLQEKLPGS